MLQAKTLLRDRLRTLSTTLEIDAVTNKSLTDIPHNESAKMLRNGLAVVGFNALEDFVKTRTSEILSEIGKSGIKFSELPRKLQCATTFRAVKALGYQLTLKDNEQDRIIYIQEQALKISSTANTAYELFPHSFGYDIANIKDDTVSEILKSFLIEDAWKEMTIIGSKIGLIALPLKEAFNNAAQRRHQAAHVAQTDTPQNDIKQFISEAFAIAISFDCFISKALSLIVGYNVLYLAGKNKIDHSSIKLRVIKFYDNKWREYIEGKTKAYRTNLNRKIIEDGAKKRAIKNHELFVVFDADNSIDYWECY